MSAPHRPLLPPLRKSLQFKPIATGHNIMTRFRIGTLLGVCMCMLVSTQLPTPANGQAPNETTAHAGAGAGAGAGSGMVGGYLLGTLDKLEAMAKVATTLPISRVYLAFARCVLHTVRRTYHAHTTHKHATTRLVFACSSIFGHGVVWSLRIPLSLWQWCCLPHCFAAFAPPTMLEQHSPTRWVFVQLDLPIWWLLL